MSAFFLLAGATACGGNARDPAAQQGHDHKHHEHGAAADAGGLRLVLSTLEFELGKQQLAFRILDASGSPVTEYEVAQKRKLHLIFVRRDLTQFQHVHPRLDGSGAWTIDVGFAKPGVYRIFADFVPAGGAETVLAADVIVGSPHAAVEPMPNPENVVRTGDYVVRVQARMLDAPGGGELQLAIRRDGAPVTDLQPYLGALGHAVIIRGYDLDYLHAHPLTTRPDPAGILRFHVELPSAGLYRAFVEFRHENRVRVVSFALAANG